ncbi:MAG: tryptophan-rich sensory protein [Clostridiales bacterium]|nr:tryptophan-rich sensory protein [Clostridiales bacterium]
MSGMKEFAELKQPPLSPPGWLFPVVWTALYTLMGISAARVYLANTIDTKPALIIYAVQLLVNALWTPIFFQLELRLVAFVWLLILLGLVVVMTGKFKKVDTLAGNLQFPYIIWLLFAGYLNLAVFILNR